MKTFSTAFLVAAVAIVLTAGASEARAYTVYLRAARTTLTMPDGTVVPMWGFARDKGFNPSDAADRGKVSVPGPALAVPPGDPELVVMLRNDLDVPISLTIPGLRAERAGSPVRVDGRIVSTTHQTPPGNATPGVYRFVVKPGTYLYRSATDIAVQVQMGLYGAIKQDHSVASMRREAYPGVGYEREAVFVFSEIDPVVHAAVDAGEYGPGRSLTSVVDYKPRYFLVNGKAWTPGSAPTVNARAGQRTLLRLLNAGARNRAPTVTGLRMEVAAEGGYVRARGSQPYSIALAPLGTADVVVRPDQAGRFALFDRAMGLSNGAGESGGMLAHLVFSAPARGASPSRMPGGGQPATAIPRRGVLPVTR